MASATPAAVAAALVPLRDVHTLHQKPQAKRRLSDQRRKQNGGNDQIRDGGGEKRRKTGDEITEAGELHQYADELRKIAGLEDQIAIHQTRAAEKYES